MHTKVHDRVRFGPFEYDTNTSELCFEGRRTRLQEQPAQVLRLMLERPGQIVTREELHCALWPSDTFVDFDNGLNVAISKIRQALKDSPSAPAYVETVPRKGYRFIAAIQTYSVVAENAAPATPIAPAVPERGNLRGFAFLVSAGLALVAAAVSLFVLWGPESAPVAPTLLKGRSIAVLPFADYTGNGEQAYLAESITDGLINDLAALGVPRVISRQSMMRYRRSTQTAAQIGKDLGADLLVEGSLSRSTAGFVINVQVIDAASDQNRWAARYQRLSIGEATLTDDIASAIAGHLGLVASDALAARWAGRRSINPEARDEYLRGRFYWNKRTDTAFRKAAQHLQAAVRLQPDYALAWSGLADLYTVGGASAFEGRRPMLDGRRADGVSLAREALRLDPSLGEAHAALGKMLMADWKWQDALNELRIAVQLSPQYATGRQWYGTLLARLHICDEAIAQVKIGADLDPLTPIINEAVGSTYMMCDKPELVIPVIGRLVDMHPDFASAYIRLGGAYERLGRTFDAISAYKRTLRLVPDHVLAMAALAALYARTGNLKESRRTLGEINRLCPDDPECDFARAHVYAGMNDAPGVFRSLEKAVAGHASLLDRLLCDWRLSAYRNDPRFKRIVALVGLTPFDTAHTPSSATIGALRP
jgi:DNA-binding winged helix-turn-helix (wHTH) protein/TolB-like protein/Flp pilus assembly protein TadD